MEMRHYCREGGFQWDPHRRYGRGKASHRVLPQGLWLCPDESWSDWLFTHSEGIPVASLDEEWRFEVSTERVLWLDTLAKVEQLNLECLPDRFGWGSVLYRYAGIFYDPAVGAKTRYARTWTVPSLCLWDLRNVRGEPRQANALEDDE